MKEEHIRKNTEFEDMVSVKCLKHKYPDRTEVSICGLDFIAKKGEKIALIGGNGSGKTTFLMHIIGLLKASEGDVRVLGIDPAKDYKKIRKHVGVVVQNVEDQMIGPTVSDDIAFSLINYGFSLEEIEKRVREVMVDLGIDGLKDKLIHYLSGGEKKKVALAGAAVLKPKILILDEALAGVDPAGIDLILNFLDRLNRESETLIIMVANDMDVVRKFSQKVYLLHKGEIIFGGPCEKLKEGGYDLCRH